VRHACIRRFAACAVIAFALSLLQGSFCDAQAGTLNDNEIALINVIRGPFNYGGKVYYARESYVNRAIAYMQADGFDLTASERDSAIATAYASVKEAIDKGYLYVAVVDTAAQSVMGASEQTEIGPGVGSAPGSEAGRPEPADTMTQTLAAEPDMATNPGPGETKAAEAAAAGSSGSGSEPSTGTGGSLDDTGSDAVAGSGGAGPAASTPQTETHSADETLEAGGADTAAQNQTTPAPAAGGARADAEGSSAASADTGGSSSDGEALGAASSTGAAPDSPDADAKAPGATTAAPDADTKAPDDTTATPDADAKAPGATTATPDADAKAPGAATAAPPDAARSPEPRKPFGEKLMGLIRSNPGVFFGLVAALAVVLTVFGIRLEQLFGRRRRNHRP
jgi:hypothetical protein